MHLDELIDQVLAELIVGTDAGKFQWDPPHTGSIQWSLEVSCFVFTFHPHSGDLNVRWHNDEQSIEHVIPEQGCDTTALMDALEGDLNSDNVTDYKERLYQGDFTELANVRVGLIHDVCIRALKCLRGI